ncbi:peptidase inhibitor family I36 protein [Nostoc sp. CALU 546]|uniref:peptidase inhibitor family I36 protein n=1 Tax=Nostoc sp. CALU 546 TaxID=1867241 RepID=UPI003B67EDD6
MSNINKQSQSLDKVAGVQDISHESAATCSGGTITLYDGPNFTGTPVTYIGGVGFQTPSLGGFNNRASSFQVASGHTWRLFTGQNYTGSNVVLGGFFGQSGNFGLGFDNNVESIRRI